MNLIKKIAIFAIVVSITLSVDNGLGITPPMGWNSWNKFGCNISEVLIRKTADKLIELGLAQKGYKYVNLDDCWQIDRDNQTKEIIEDKNTFPSGIPALAQYIHSKGLKIGLYSDAGYKTCQGRPGSYGFQKIDATTYANWEQKQNQQTFRIDYLKYDNCNKPDVSAKLRYYAMYKALNETGRPIFYSMCNWGQEDSATWASSYVNSWRTTGDIKDTWHSFIHLLDRNAGLEKYAGPGGWNDPDMLEVGNGGMTFNQYYAHFALWAVLKAPLLIGCDLTDISNQTLEILGNQELIAINQDSLGKQARRIKRNIYVGGVREVWGGELSGDRYVVVFFNQGLVSVPIEVSIRDELKQEYSSYTQRDPIRHKNTGISTYDIVKVNVESHSVEVRILNLDKIEKSRSPQITLSQE